jgi:hypothetical protein
MLNAVQEQSANVLEGGDGRMPVRDRFTEQAPVECLRDSFVPGSEIRVFHEARIVAGSGRLGKARLLPEQCFNEMKFVRNE